MKLGKTLKKSRTQMGLSLRALEKLSGVSNAVISQIETGYVKNPGFWTVAAIAGELGLDMEDLADGHQ